MTKAGGDAILRAENLTKYFDASEGFVDSLLGREALVKAVDGVDLELYEGETLGIVGESGCGKTTLGRTLLRLIEPTAGTVYYRDEELTAASGSRLRDLRKDLQYIFQDPFSSLNPRLTVGDIIGEPLDIHGIATGDERLARVYELLETVGLNANHAHRYPHEFSGGQRQRIGIARSLAVDPEVIVCDEPVSALDVSVQAQILNLLEDLQAEFGLSYIFIAHDLSVVEHISDRIAVMYLGDIVEAGTTEEVFSPPYHPYAEALLSAIPEPDPLWEADRILLPGSVPSPINPPSGCRFHTRCPRIIPPEQYDVDQEVWRSIMDLRLRCRGADTLPVAAVIGTAGGTPGQTDLTEVSRTELDDRVRTEFSIPSPVSDPSAERVISEVVDRLHAGDIDAASELLYAAFETPCEAVRPDPVERAATHRIACLLYDDRFTQDDRSVTDDPTGDVVADD